MIADIALNCDELEVDRTISDSIAVLAELAACIVLGMRSLCMLRAGTLAQMLSCWRFFA